MARMEWSTQRARSFEPRMPATMVRCGVIDAPWQWCCPRRSRGERWIIISRTRLWDGGGVVAFQRVVYDPCWANGVVEGFEVPKGAVRDDVGEVERPYGLVAEDAEGGCSKGGTATQCIVPLIGMGSLPENTVFCAESAPKAEEPRGQSNGAVTAVGLGKKSD